ncbi:acyl-CoA reductase [Tunicatimonas pelagia]|uniref:acyl-CoA reductase n=1 Tax=Tunicatimonas pelagia TaxID=931531 RepID=UPI00266679D6|nr:acyl-CoA reductase [Tunicatimonas pelagia]WKN45277.1 acyl-CoA reductase [Tunicatimonas pelagia]
MLNLDDRIRVFAAVGTVLKNLDKNEQNELVQRARSDNAWFTEENVLLAKEGLQRYLSEEKLRQWVTDLPTQPSSVKKIGLVMAGNIPWVGFHDLLTVLISGQHAMIKLSSQDSFLMRYIINIITELEPQLASLITVVDKLNTADAIIATGGDNTSRYFEYYFAKYPHIIRKNRTGVAVLSGHETEKELNALGEDIFRYFGLGCRNVSKIFVPEEYNFESLFRTLEAYQTVAHHHKYNNNYDYNKSIYLVNREPFLDTGFALFRQSDQLVSPISVVYYEPYQNQNELTQKLLANEEKTQCVVAQESIYPNQKNYVPFGQAQQPKLWDYADGVNTLKFVQSVTEG